MSSTAPIVSLVRRGGARLRPTLIRNISSSSSSSPNSRAQSEPITPEWPIPSQPTWSVKELLNSYPTPSLSHETLAKIHKLSALEMPEVGSEEYNIMKENMEKLVKLVEAVRHVELPEDIEGGFPTHGWANAEVDAGTVERKVEEPLPDTNAGTGVELLRFAEMRSGDFFTVPRVPRRRHDPKSQEDEGSS